MADEIHVVYADVEALATSLETAADALDALEDNDRYDLSPDVVTAHEDLANRWDERRGHLVENLRASSTTLRAVAASFLETDEGLAAEAPTMTGDSA